MNKSVTSRGDILRESRLLVMREGLGAVSMRSVARACGIAVGSLYNYFPSKDALIDAAKPTELTEPSQSRVARGRRELARLLAG